MLSDKERSDGTTLVLLPIGEVRERPGRCPPWILVGPDGAEHEPTNAFLRDLVASDRSPLTCRSYAYDLQHFFRYLATIGVAWQRVTQAEIRDYVLWLRSAPNPSRARTKPTSPPPGSVNPVTDKAELADEFAPRTINHRLSAIRSFFDYHLRTTGRPLVNPVPPTGRAGERVGAHHSPHEPWPAQRRAPYRQKTPDRPPRRIPDQQWEELFGALTTDRDRAIFSMLVSSGARAAELLGMRGQDVDYGRQAARLVTKGSRDERWVAASPEAFVWLVRYLADGFAAGRGEPLWWALRGTRRPLSYWALRAVLERANERLGTNWVLHDLRHTCAMRLADDPEVSLVDLQEHMRHRHLSTTATNYLRPRADEVIAHVQAHHQRQQQRLDDGPAPATTPTGTSPAAGWAYDNADLDVLFGRERP